MARHAPLIAMNQEQIMSRFERPKLDRLDLKIMDTLYREGRITKTEMSQEVGLSATRCWERMRKLETAGIIRGYHADIDLRRLLHLSLYQVQAKLANGSPTSLRQFEHFIMRIDEVISCQAVLGSVDYLMTVVAPDTETFLVIMDEILESSLNKFEFTTFPISKTVKSRHTVPLMSLMTIVNRVADG
jgi:Lrp/AsnC family transcriptional regulator of ectoine degradation